MRSRYRGFNWAYTWCTTRGDSRFSAFGRSLVPPVLSFFQSSNFLSRLLFILISSLAHPLTTSGSLMWCLCDFTSLHTVLYLCSLTCSCRVSRFIYRSFFSSEDWLSFCKMRSNTVHRKRWTFHSCSCRSWASLFLCSSFKVILVESALRTAEGLVPAPTCKGSGPNPRSVLPRRTLFLPRCTGSVLHLGRAVHSRVYVLFPSSVILLFSSVRWLSSSASCNPI